MTDTPAPTAAPAAALDAERADLLETLRAHRGFLRQTVQGLTDAQARLRPTASALCLGGLVKHLALVERQWVRFVLGGPAAMDEGLDADTWAAGFELLPHETLADVLAEYDEVARATDELVATLPDLDAVQLLPEAPWFAPGATRSARRVLLHLVAETSQHAGHADILRESVDGSRTMG